MEKAKRITEVYYMDYQINKLVNNQNNFSFWYITYRGKLVMVSLDFRHFWNYPIPKIIQNFGDFFLDIQV